MNSLNPDFFRNPFSSPVFSNDNNSDNTVEKTDINSLRNDIFTNMFNNRNTMSPRGENNNNDSYPSCPCKPSIPDCKNDCNNNCNNDCDNGCNNDCNDSWNDDYSQGDNGCAHSHKNDCNMYLAIANIPMQCFTSLYCPHDALNAGTLFQELDLPFSGSRCKHR